MGYYAGLLRSAYGKLGFTVSDVAEMTVSDILLAEKGHEDKLDNDEVNFRKLARLLVLVNADPKSSRTPDIDTIWPPRYAARKKQSELLNKDRVQMMLEAYKNKHKN